MWYLVPYRDKIGPNVDQIYHNADNFLRKKKKMQYDSDLRWNSYETNILDTFGGLLDSEALSDVTLFCEGKNRSLTPDLPVIHGRVVLVPRKK